MNDDHIDADQPQKQTAAPSVTFSEGLTGQLKELTFDAIEWPSDRWREVYPTDKISIIFLFKVAPTTVPATGTVETLTITWTNSDTYLLTGTLDQFDIKGANIDGDIEAVASLHVISSERIGGNIKLTAMEKARFSQWLIENITERVVPQDENNDAALVYNLVHRVRGDNDLYKYAAEQDAEIAGWRYYEIHGYDS